MKKKITFLIILCSIVFNINTKAQDGTLDLTFNPGAGVNNTVSTTAIQSDGKIIIGGSFTTYDGTTRNHIVRLNTDGTLDGTFNLGTGANNAVYTTAIQSDGKIIIGGDFTTYNGTERNRIARLNTDGTLDVTFDPGTGTNGYVFTTAIQSDGKIIIGGIFTTYNGTARNSIARLNTDGTLDVTFDPGTGASSHVNTTAIQSDGKIIIGGLFATYNGTARNHIARLNTDGTLDVTFEPGTGTDNWVLTTAIQSDGKIIIGGWFTIYNGTARNNIARLNVNGSLDGTFDPGTGASNTIWTSAIQSDGKIIIGGDFTVYNGIARNRIARILVSGVGIKENTNKDYFTIYPNPSEGIVSLNFEGYTGDIKITINNAMGELMLTENMTAVSDNFIKTIDMAKYPNGIYYIQIVNNGKAFVQKVAKL